MFGRGFIPAVLEFLGKTGVGKIKEGVVVGARAPYGPFLFSL